MVELARREQMWGAIHRHALGRLGVKRLSVAALENYGATQVFLLEGGQNSFPVGAWHSEYWPLDL